MVDRRARSAALLAGFTLAGLLAAVLVIQLRAGSWPASSWTPRYWEASYPSSVVAWRVEEDAAGRTETNLPIRYYPDRCKDIHSAFMADPEVVYSPTAVMVRLHVADLVMGSTDGDNTAYLPTCVIRPADGIVTYIGLDEPLGGRQLLDGSTWPPREVSP
jgi:hypothetical protein